ncbi:hypothetical protein [Fredinandcohnia quinoae]|uniref:Uncharacterized protein n=1 Tax=Fredinandcohnia quinoae TaxID=2918902 RepID=A0AAW5E0S6_9BACI|nr:hypothetical protein [Fredinandcohnia sp. SECRCQ15]MCH1624304.1 hypothetical protein [Fredinandcohnia sp. SECRCQ15]
MESKLKMINAVKYVGATVLIIGIVIFSLGFFDSGSSTLTPIGIGTIVGAVFIFLMGMFLVATEEMTEKSQKNLI